MAQMIAIDDVRSVKGRGFPRNDCGKRDERFIKTLARLGIEST